jgi:hypothetical protein
MPTRTAFLATLAGLLLLLLAVVALPMRFSQGYYAKIGIKRTGCGDTLRDIFIHVGRDSRLSINGMELKPEAFESHLREIYSTRAERMLFLMADPEVEFARVANTMDVCFRHVQYVALMTPAALSGPGDCFGFVAPPTVDSIHPTPPAPATVKEVPLWRLGR